MPQSPSFDDLNQIGYEETQLTQEDVYEYPLSTLQVEAVDFPKVRVFGRVKNTGVFIQFIETSEYTLANIGETTIVTFLDVAFNVFGIDINDYESFTVKEIADEPEEVVDYTTIRALKIEQLQLDQKNAVDNLKFLYNILSTRVLKFPTSAITSKEVIVPAPLHDTFFVYDEVKGWVLKTFDNLEDNFTELIAKLEQDLVDYVDEVNKPELDRYVEEVKKPEIDDYVEDTVSEQTLYFVQGSAKEYSGTNPSGIADVTDQFGLLQTEIINGIAPLTSRPNGFLEGTSFVATEDFDTTIEGVLTPVKNGQFISWIGGRWYVTAPSFPDRTFNFGTVADMQTSAYLLVGDKINLWGYHTLGDGAGHKRVKSLTDDGTGIALDSGGFANLIIDNTTTLASFGITDGYVVDDLFFNSIKAISDKDYKVKSGFTGIITVDKCNDPFIIDSNIHLDFSGIIFKVTTDADDHLKPLFHFTTTNLISSYNFKLENFKYDGSDFGTDWGSVNPKGQLAIFFVEGYVNAHYSNAYVTDLFYSCIFKTRQATNVLIENVYGLRVGGRSSDNTEDARGDAFYFGNLRDDNDVSVKIKNCNIIGYDAIDTPADNPDKSASHSGRVGITLESFDPYKTTVNKKITVENCHFYNFDRVSHVENSLNTKINFINCTFNEFSAVIRDVTTVGDLTGASFDNCDFVRGLSIAGIDGSASIIFGLGVEGENYSFNNCRFALDDINKFRFFAGLADSNVKISNSFITNSVDEVLVIADSCSNIKFDHCNLVGNRFVYTNCLPDFIGVEFSKYHKTSYNNIYGNGANQSKKQIFSGCIFNDFNVKTHTQSFKTVFEKNEFNVTGDFNDNFNDEATINSFIYANFNTADVNINDCRFENKNFGNGLSVITNNSEYSVSNFISNFFINCQFININETYFSLMLKNNEFRNSLTVSPTVHILDFTGSKVFVKNNFFSVAGSSVDIIAEGTGVVEENYNTTGGGLTLIP